MKQKRLGKLPRRYRFFLNPYLDIRFTKCPRCDQGTRLRKFALGVYVEDGPAPMVLGYTCRFCVKCELIIVHKNELETLLATLLDRVDPQAIGNEYLVFGTVEQAFWRRSLKQPTAFAEMREHLADFKEYLDFTYRPAGWYRDDDEAE